VPGRILDKPSAKDRTHRCGNRGKAGPGPDRLTSRFLIKAGTDNREAPRDQKGGSDTLYAAGDD
jgi:hypothetical protein